MVIRNFCNFLLNYLNLLFCRKEAYSRYHKACVEVDREVAKGQAPDRQARVLEKEGNKKKYWDEFEECRKHQKISFEELCKKREWILAATLNVVGQVRTQLYMQAHHLGSRSSIEYTNSLKF